MVLAGNKTPAPNHLRPSEPGLLDETQIAQLVESVHTNAGEASRQATGAAVSNLDLYQVNCTFYDVRGRDAPSLPLGAGNPVICPRRASNILRRPAGRG